MDSTPVAPPRTKRKARQNSLPAKVSSTAPPPSLPPDVKPIKMTAAKPKPARPEPPKSYKQGNLTAPSPATPVSTTKVFPPLSEKHGSEKQVNQKQERARVSSLPPHSSTDTRNQQASKNKVVLAQIYGNHNDHYTSAPKKRARKSKDKAAEPTLTIIYTRQEEVQKHQTVASRPPKSPLPFKSSSNTSSIISSLSSVKALKSKQMKGKTDKVLGLSRQLTRKNFSMLPAPLPKPNPNKELGLTASMNDDVYDYVNPSKARYTPAPLNREMQLSRELDGLDLTVYPHNGTPDIKNSASSHDGAYTIINPEDVTDTVYTVPRQLSLPSTGIIDLIGGASEKADEDSICTENVSYNTILQSPAVSSNTDCTYTLPRCLSDTYIHSNKDAEESTDDGIFTENVSYNAVKQSVSSKTPALPRFQSDTGHVNMTHHDGKEDSALPNGSSRSGNVDSSGYVDVVRLESSVLEYDDVVHPNSATSSRDYDNITYGDTNNVTVLENGTSYVNVKKGTHPPHTSSKSPSKFPSTLPSKSGHVVSSKPAENTSNDDYTPLSYDTVDYVSIYEAYQK